MKAPVRRRRDPQSAVRLAPARQTHRRPAPGTCDEMETAGGSLVTCHWSFALRFIGAQQVNLHGAGGGEDAEVNFRAALHRGVEVGDVSDLIELSAPLQQL